MTVNFYDGVPVAQINRIVHGAPEFYISYNPSVRDYGVRTTALYIKSTGQFLILAGNHSKQYEGLTFQESLTYFYDNVNEAIPQSEHGKVFVFSGGKAVYADGGF